jgi:cytochrome c oxidase assembly protein subunit 15
MHSSHDRKTLLRRMAWLTLCLLLAVTCLSAYLRHSAAGVGCEPWPACFGQGDRAVPGSIVVAGQALTAARAAHRITATLALLLSVAMLVISLARQPRLSRAGRFSLALVGIALALALLGVVTPGSRTPAVAIGNLLGGFAMLAVAARLAGEPPQDGLGVVAIGMAVLLVLQTVGGVFVSASQAGLACTDLRECFEQSRAAGWDWRALDPRQVAPFAVGTPHSEGALPMLLHRLASLVVVPALVGFAMLAMRHGHRRAGVALLLLTASQVALGLALGSTGLPMVPVLLHGLATAVSLALVLRLA